MRHRVRLAHAVVVAFAWLWLGCGSSELEDDSIRVFDEALFAVGDPARPPGAESLRPVSLPDRWLSERPDVTGFAWYRFHAPPAPPGAPRQAIYLPKLNMNAAVFVNGERIGDGGTFEAPVAQAWNRPLLFSLSRRQLDQPDNEIDVLLFAYAGELGGLDPILLGPESLLRPPFEHRAFLHVTLAQIATVLTLATALFIGSFWLGARRDAMYGYLALAALALGVTSLNYHIHRPPFDYRVWTWLVHTAIDWFGVLLAHFVHRWLRVDRPAVERGLRIVAIVASVVLLAIPMRWFTTTAAIVHVGTVGVGIYCAVLIAQRRARLSRSEATITLCAATATLAFGAHDLAIHAGALPGDSLRLVNFTAVALVLGFGAVVTQQFLLAHREAETLARELEARIADNKVELARNYARLQRLEAQNVVGRERERIMREMHDGLGGNLVSTLAMVEDGQLDKAVLAGALRSALDDMRLVIDSLDPDVDDIPTLLGMIRCRLEPRLAECGLRFQWNVHDLPPLPRVSPAEFLHVMRVVQEAITNVVKHARATTITVTTGVGEDAESVFVEVSDDGEGSPRTTASGRGISNMRRRASALGGELDIKRTGAGTTVRLTIPILPRLSTDIAPLMTPRRD